MKGHFRIMVLAVLAASLGAVYFVISSNATPSATGELFHFPAGDSLQEMYLSNQYGTFAFIKENGQWGLTSPGKYRVNQEKVRLMEQSLLKLPIKRLLPEEREEYGFDAPVATVDMVSVRGIRQSLVIGAFTPSQAQVYIKDAKGEEVYVCDMGSISQFDGSLNAYRTKDIYSVDLLNLSSLTYYKNNEKLVSLAHPSPQVWQLTYPYQAGARIIEMTEFLVNLQEYAAAKYPDPTRLDLEGWGLVKPPHILELVDVQGNSQRLEFGNVENGLMYVRIGSEEDVARVFSTDVDFSILSPEKLLFELPLRTTIDQVEKIAVLSPTTKVIIELDHTTSPARMISNGRELDLDKFVAFFVKYSGLAADGHQVGQPVGDPVLTLTTTLRDGSTQTLQLLPRDDDTLYMDANGRTEFFISKEKVAVLLDRLNQAVPSDP